MAKISKQPGGFQNLGHLRGPAGPGGVPGQRPPPPGQGGVLPKGRFAPAQEALAVIGGGDELRDGLLHVRVHHRDDGPSGGQIFVHPDGHHVLGGAVEAHQRQRCVVDVGGVQRVDADMFAILRFE